MHSKDKILIHDKNGNVTGGFAITSLLPLITAIAGPVFEKILGKGMADHISCGSASGGGVKYKLRKTHGKGTFEDVVEVLKLGNPFGMGSGSHGGAAGFGAVSHGGNGVYQVPHVQGGSMNDVYGFPIQYGEVSYPHGGAAGFGAIGFGSRAVSSGGANKKKKHHPKKPTVKKGGFAVDQLHSNNYSGFNPTYTKAMFPVNLA